MNESRKYILVEYTFAGKRVTSAIHNLDFWKFMIENPSAVVIKK